MEECCRGREGRLASDDLGPEESAWLLQGVKTVDEVSSPKLRPSSEAVLAAQTANATSKASEEGAAEAKSEQAAKAAARAGLPAWAKLSRIHRLLIRDVIVLCITLALPFVPSVRAVAQGQEALIPIVGLILALVPVSATNIGSQAAVLVNFILSWVLLAPWVFLTVAITPHNMGGFLAMIALAVLVAMYLGFLAPAWMLMFVVEAIVIGILAPPIWQILNGPGASAKTQEEIWGQVANIVGITTMSFLAAPALHLAGALLIFPWRSTVATRCALSRKLMTLAALLRALRGLYGRVGRFTMNPSEQQGFLFLDEEDLETLEKARSAELASSIEADGTLVSSLLETRWSFDGSGMRLLRLHELTLAFARHARSASSDLLAKYRRMMSEAAEAPERVEQGLEREKSAAAALDQDQEGPVFGFAEKQRLLELVHVLNEQLEESCPVLAAQMMEQGDGAVRIAALAEIQSRMESVSDELGELCVRWAKVYIRSQLRLYRDEGKRANRDEPFKRTKLLTYVMTLRRMVGSFAALVSLCAELEDARKTKSFWRTSGKDVANEWWMSLWARATVMEANAITSPLRVPGAKAACGRAMSAVKRTLSTPAFHAALKSAFGTTLLVMLGILESTSNVYSEAHLMNAIITFQVILFKLQQGLVLERTAQRVSGILGAYIYAGACWELACVGGCTALGGWSLYLLELPALFAYLWIRQTNFAQGYAGFAFVRTYASLVAPLVTATADDNETASSSTYWTFGGWVVLSSLLGAVLALFLGLCVWPTSGRTSLRGLIAKVSRRLAVASEAVVLLRYKDRFGVQATSPELERAEAELARIIWIETGPLLHAVSIETALTVRFGAPVGQYASAVESLKALWRGVWKLHHLGGVRAYLRNDAGMPERRVSPFVARNLLVMNRQLSNALVLAASSLESGQRHPLPVLRPVIASPLLMREVLDDFVLLCYRDDLLMGRLLDSPQLDFVAHLILFHDIEVDLAYALATLFDFLEQFLNVPSNRDELRGQDLKSLQLFDGLDQDTEANPVADAIDAGRSEEEIRLLVSSAWSPVEPDEPTGAVQVPSNESGTSGALAGVDGVQDQGGAGSPGPWGGLGGEALLSEKAQQ